MVATRDGGLLVFRKSELCLIAFKTHELRGFGRFEQVLAVLLLELFGDVFQQAVIPVDAAQMDISVGGQHVEVSRRIFHNGRIERAASQIKNQDGLGLGTVGQTDTQFVMPPGKGQRGCGRFVDNVNHIQPADAARILGRLPPQVIEVVRHGNDRIADLFPQFFFGVLFQFFQNQRGQELGRNLSSIKGVIEIVFGFSHVPLDAFHDIFGVFHGRPHAVGTDDDMSRGSQQDQAGGFAVAILVLDRDRLALFVQIGQRGVGGSQIDADGQAFLKLHGHASMIKPAGR